MPIDNNQELIEAYFAVVGLNDHARYVKKQILNSGIEVPNYYAKYRALANSGLKLNKKVLTILEQLCSGELNPEIARQERMQRLQDDLRLTGKIGGSSADDRGVVRAGYDHKK